VVEIADGTVAQSLGFQRGDVLVSVNNTKIAKTRDLEKVAEAGARVWRVIIQRGGRQISATFGG
jgi:type II secretory pathway component PulC